MMVGLNAYSLYKGFDNVQSVTLRKPMGNMSLHVFKVRKR
jgi:hypothetical protein